MSHDQLRALMEHAEEAGCINLFAFTQAVTELELDDEEVSSFFEQFEERGIELTDDCSLPDVTETHFSNETVAAMTTDSLQLFLNEAGRYALLTAAEEVELAKLIERGDPRAKDRMINSNLRKSLEMIGRELGLTRERVRQIETKALERLAREREIAALAPA
jgi:RNA polymerase primary sigma factor